MCLDILKPVSTKKGYGWKTFAMDDGQLYSWIDKDRGRERQLLPREWIKDCRDIPIMMDNGFSYPTGYHIFVTKRSAEKWKINEEVIRKVRFHNVVATGIQKGLKKPQKFQVIVAKEIYIEDKE